MSIVKKRCGCGEARWTKCTDPWYLKVVEVTDASGHTRSYAPNLTRYARVVLNRAITTKTEAEEVGEDVRRAIRDGTFQDARTQRTANIAQAIAQGRTIAELAPSYDAAHIDGDPVKKPNSKVNDRAILKRLSIAFADRPAASLDINDLVAFRRGLDVANSTWNKHRTFIGQFFRWAKWSGHIEVDPIAAAPPDMVKLLRRKKARQRLRRINDTEWANLLEAAQENRYADVSTRVRALLIALWETAARIGELLALQWRDVHLEQRYLFIRAEEDGAGKTEEGRTIDLSQPLYDVLLTLQMDPAGQRFPRAAYVFGNSYGERVKSIDKAFNTLVLRANNIEPEWTGRGGSLIEASRAELSRIDLNVHDIRHETACRWLASGCFDLAQISKRLGHTTVAQTATYLHAETGSLRHAQRQYDQHRQQEEQQEKTAQSAQTPYKVRTNTAGRSNRAQLPRLIKGRNTPHNQ